METYEANLNAMGDFAKSVRLNLKKLGMRRCSLALIYRQCKAPVAGQRISWYCAFWRWFQALWMANRPGAEYLLEDFLARVTALRELDEFQSEEERALLAAADGEHGDIVRATFLNADVDRIMKEITEDIVIKRRLLAFYAAQQLRARAA